MLALALTIGVFLFCCLVGLAILTALDVRRNMLQGMLLAPSIGLATTVLVVFTLSRAGLPVGAFGAILTSIFLLSSVAILWYRRPVLPWRRYAPFAAIFAVTLAAVGWPAWLYGFDWIGYANDDMATEALWGQHLIQVGINVVPDTTRLLTGIDYGELAWIAHHVGNERPGARLLLGTLTVSTGLTIHQVYMPLILAFHLALVSAAAALVAHSYRSQVAALVTAGLVGISSLTSLATMNQLMGQVGGIGLLAASTTLLLRPYARRRRAMVGQGLLIALLVSGQLIWYPESVPFLGAAYGLYVGIGVLRRRIRLQPLFGVGIVAGISLLIFLNSYALISAQFMLSQSTGAHVLGTDDKAEMLRQVFRTYLIPTGLANLWGLQTIGSQPIDEPWNSGSILLGAGLLLSAGVTALVLAWRRQPGALVTLVMLAVSALFFSQRSGFGLYKVAMFIQPFVLGTLVLGWLGLTRMLPWRVALPWRLAPPVLLGLAGLHAQIAYVGMSLGDTTSTQLPGGTETRIVSEFRQVLDSAPPGPIALDTVDSVLAKIQAVYTIGRPAEFLSRDFFGTVIYMCGFDKPASWADAVASVVTRSVQESYCSTIMTDFSLQNDDPRRGVDRFWSVSTGSTVHADACPTLILSTGLRSILNRRSTPNDGTNFVARTCDEQNNLAFIDSEMGRQHYQAGIGEVGLFKLEPEPLWRTGTMAGLGRLVLFRALNPSQSPRLVLDLTASYKGDGENLLPPAAAVGATRESFPMTGRGSARVFSPPLTPQMINGVPYLAIDMGADGQYFPENRTGLMQLYGADYRVDFRRMTGFARDISLVSENDYQHLTPPSVIRDFLVDLANPDLEYSGLYEDGAASESVFLGLTQPADATMFVVKGAVPETDDPDFTTQVRVLVDGHEMARRVLGTGSFELWWAAPPGTGRRRVELHFSNIQRLPGADRRPVAAFIRMIGFDGQTAETPPAYVNAFPDDLEQTGLWSAGLYEDGVAAESMFLGLTQPVEASMLIVKGVVPLVDDPNFTTEVRVLVDGYEMARRVLRPGTFAVWGAPPAGSGTGQRRVEVHFSDVQQLPGGDRRPVGALIQFVGFEGQADDVPPGRTVAQLEDFEQPGPWSAGLATDGWTGESSFIALAYPGEAANIVVRGSVPHLTDPSFTTELRVVVDGLEAASKTLGFGEFELRAPVPPGPPRRRIELRFSAVQQLPIPDGRLAAARVMFVGFEAEANAMPPAPAAPAERALPPEKIDTFPANLQNAALTYGGLDTDGWLARESFVELLQPASPADLVVRMTVPLIDNEAYVTDLQVLLDGQELARRTLGPGDIVLRLPVQTTAGRHRVELRFSADQQLPAPDSRRRAALVGQIGFEASSADAPGLAAPGSASAPGR